MTRKKKKPSGRGSWQEIPQPASRKVTALARRRMAWLAAKSLMAVVLPLAAAVAAWFGYIHLREGSERLQSVRSTQPLREVVFQTDGVLSRDWVMGRLGLEFDADVMGLDIHGKKLLLESHGQIRSATLRRQPEGLVIHLRERHPIARVAVREADGISERLVDPEGHVYEGQEYASHELAGLPFLGGIRLRVSGNGFEPLPHMNVVSSLLAAALEHTPHLYETWRVIDCSDLPHRLTVRTRGGEEYVFGQDDPAPQLRRLDMILAENRRQLTGQRRVDLSLGNPVVVR